MEAQNYKFIVSQAGTYWVKVSNNNCAKSDTITIDSCKNIINIWIPNAFTPTRGWIK